MGNSHRNGYSFFIPPTNSVLQLNFSVTNCIRKFGLMASRDTGVTKKNLLALTHTHTHLATCRTVLSQRGHLPISQSIRSIRSISRSVHITLLPRMPCRQWLQISKQLNQPNSILLANGAIFSIRNHKFQSTLCVLLLLLLSAPWWGAALRCNRCHAFDKKKTQKSCTRK